MLYLHIVAAGLFFAICRNSAICSYPKFRYFIFGTSWKSKLQFDIDQTLKQAKEWDDFLKRIDELGYEIKHGKHIAFRHKGKQIFTRAKTIGVDYTEDRLKERLTENLRIDRSIVKQIVGKIIDIKNNEKIKSSKVYEFWLRNITLRQ